MTAPIWWSEADTFGLIGWSVAVPAVAATAVFWVKASRAALWKSRCKAHKKTIARLRAADQNRRANALALPAAPKRKPPAPRTRFRWVWPGANAGHLPIPYGPEREHLETDPCAPPERRPAPLWLREWLAEDEPFLATTRELVLVEGLARNIEWANPPTWVVPHLQEAKS